MTTNIKSIAHPLLPLICSFLIILPVELQNLLDTGKIVLQSIEPYKKRKNTMKENLSFIFLLTFDSMKSNYNNCDPINNISGGEHGIGSMLRPSRIICPLKMA